MTAYLDNAATTRVCAEAVDIALETMTLGYGNPSSQHKMGRDAKKLLDSSRNMLAEAMGAATEEIFFTSGGTESDNWAILSGAEMGKRRGKHIISSKSEHAAIGKSLDLLEDRGFDVTRLDPEPDGSISPASVASSIRGDTILVSLMLVNNETGAVTDIAGIAGEIKKAGSAALLHTDAVQGFLKIPFSSKELGADLISVSGHKVHAPKGVGALYIKRGLNLPPLMVGGSQENSRRGGTESMPLIAAFGAAAKAGLENFSDTRKHLELIRKFVCDRLTVSVPYIVFLGGGAPHILSISMPGFRSEVVMNYLDARGVFVSKSSACKKGGRSHVLEAIGLGNEIIDGAIRVSFSRYTTKDEAALFCDTLAEASHKLLKVLR